MLDRREFVRELLLDRKDLLVVSGLGSPTYDVAACGDHPLNFYLWGAMGGAAMIGLGLALAQPARRVLVLTGDGEALMGMGALATIGVKRPKNLVIVVLDNGGYLAVKRAVERVAGLDRLTQPVPGHGQEEPIEGGELTLVGREALFQGGDGLGMPARAVEGDAQRVEVEGLVGRSGDDLAGQAHGPLRIAKVDRAGGQLPGVIAELQGVLPE